MLVSQQTKLICAAAVLVISMSFSHAYAHSDEEDETTKKHNSGGWNLTRRRAT